MNARSPGMTLAEVLVTAVIGSFVLMSIHQTLMIQERSARHQRGIVIAQQGSRAGIELLAAEIREISAAGGDLIDAGPGSMTFRASRALGFVCDKSSVDSQIDVWQRGEPFEAGDSVFLFVDNDPATNVDDAWAIDHVARADSIGPTASCPDWLVGNEPLPIQRLTLSIGDTIADIARGAPVRSFTHVTYSAKEFNGAWMLGRSTPDEEFVPFVGPLTANGVKFRYLNSAGEEIVPDTPARRREVARIAIAVRALAPGAVGNGPVVDELETQLYLRNR